MSTRRTFLGAAASAAAATPVASAPPLRARAAVYAVDTETQHHYDALRAELAARLGPVIVVQNDDRGGLFTLVHQGGREQVHPVPAEFELAKSVAHAPLGIYSIVAPYLSRHIPEGLPNAARFDRHDVEMVASEGPEEKGWIAPLREFGTTLATARSHLKEAHMPRELTVSSARILDAALAFVDESVRRASFGMKSFEEFTGGLKDAIGVNLAYASRAQIDGVGRLMRRWRDRVGARKWPGLYVVVLSIWTTSAPNQNSLVIKGYLDPAYADSHLIDLPTAQPPADPVAVALDNLARIVQDNVAAELVFPTDRGLADALKGPEDLLAPEIQRQLGCPHR
ncbi:hypothetical protein [Streptomyces acidiscabies]|uniref:hypothetical protein n=1 Tax=Streptomyces acidiscabies TaxID=42234 RepID=UPI0038F753EE